LSVGIAIIGIAVLTVAALMLPAKTISDASTGEQVTLKGELLNSRTTEKTTQLTIRTECTLRATIFDKVNLTRGPITAHGTLEGEWPRITIDEVTQQQK
jgi:hypothetical protein